MEIISKLASSLNRRDEVPNQELAAAIAAKGDTAAVAEVVKNLENKAKAIRYDCIKVLYEVGYQKPSLIAPFYPKLVELIATKDNRMQWGVMTALGCLVGERPQELAAILPDLASIADAGSVITRDNFVAILIRLYKRATTADASSYLIDQMAKCPTNQLPMYAENAQLVIRSEDRPQIIHVLKSRLDEIEKESKRKRVEKVIAKLGK